MKIRGQQLKKLAAEKELTIDQLAQAIERTGLTGERARSAVGNWMRGTDHPRCKSEDITRLAGALGVQVSDIARFQSTLRNHRGSPRKVKLIVDLIHGKNVVTAENMLTFTTKRAAVDVKKALLAARAEAEQANADVETLVVTESTVGAGPHMKRFQPKDRGRAHPILKRSSHITVGLEQRVGRGGKERK